MSQNVPNLVVENAHLMFKNFSGREDTYNAAGMRNFCLIINQDVADAMKAQGWNIKFLKPKEPGDVPVPYIKVNVSYKQTAPKIYLIAGPGGQKTALTEDNVNQLDTAELINVDCEISPYEWAPGKLSGYLKTMYATIRPDPFAEKYSNPSTEGDLPWV